MIAAEKAPVERPVTIFWDRHQIPFIEAQTDADLAVALGMVHAHLRLGQMELMRRLSQGRVSELIGRMGLGIDCLVRTFDIKRATEATLKAMPAETRNWLEGFVRGVNHQLFHGSGLPSEFQLLSLPREAWSAPDIVTLGRLVSADVNWIVWLRLLKFRSRPDWASLWRRILRHDLLSFESGAGSPELSPAAELLLGSVLRSGSNSLALSGERSESGGALIASDPHLSITVPNPWLIAGLHSRSHHAVGYMIPGIPFIAFGRNPGVAWGGASLHAASSDLVALPPDAEVRERIETVAIRGERPLSLRIEESAYGPVVSTLPAFRFAGPRVAMRWVGHRPSDEFSAMLNAGRARNSEEFRQALTGFAIPGLQMNFASAAGDIGQIMAASLPRRKSALPEDIVTPPKDGWDHLMTSAELPARLNPNEGFVAAANAHPERDLPVVGFHFSPPDRVRRLARLLTGSAKLSVEDLMRIQRDVHLSRSIGEREHFIAWASEMKHLDAKPLDGDAQNLLAALQSWDGNYDANSEGALAFELLLFHLARVLVPKARQHAYDAVWGMRALIWADILTTDGMTRSGAVQRALRSAGREFGKGGRTWGSRHRLKLSHPLGSVPALGRFYRFADLPAAGTSETLMKTAHGLTNRRHQARYGSVARHISDLSDLDDNRFVLLGGQDGWFGSTTFLDQVPLWQRGVYIQVPLRPETVRARFPHRVVLTP